jgi:tRNA-dihydrouridine synthase B
VLVRTGADAIMIGRAAQGRPWIFREIAHFLAHGVELPPPPTRDVQQWLATHLFDHYALYGEFTGVRSARKHIGWAVHGLPGGAAFRAHMNTIEDAQIQVAAMQEFFEHLASQHPLWPSPCRAVDDAINDPQSTLAA